MSLPERGFECLLRIKALNNPLVEWSGTLVACDRLIAPGGSSVHSLSMAASSCSGSQGGSTPPPALSLVASD